MALGVPVHRLLQAADSASVCLSKGIDASVGFVIVGSKSFIAKAKRLRKTLGGGRRQIGVLCVAASVALEYNVGKLKGDHKKANVLADGLNQIKGLKVDITSVETNIDTLYWHYGKQYIDVLKGVWTSFLEIALLSWTIVIATASRRDSSLHKAGNLLLIVLILIWFSVICSFRFLISRIILFLCSLYLVV